MKRNDFVVMLEHADPNDAEELRDILTMMAQELGEHEEEIDQIKARIDKINDTLPSTSLRDW